MPLLDIKTSPQGHRYAAIQYKKVSGEHAEETIEEEVSGIVEIDRGAMDEGTRARLLAKKAPAEPAPVVSPGPVPPTVAASISELPADEKVVVHFTIARPALETAQQRLDRRVALGLVSTDSQALEARLDVLEEIRADVAASLAPTIDELQDRGLEIVYQCSHGTCLLVRGLPAQIIDAADGLEAIQRVDAQAKLSHDATHVHGVGGLERVYQNEVALDAGYDGGWPYSVYAAIIEWSGGFDDDHPVFKESSGSATRIKSKHDCDDADCAWVSDFSPTADHGTVTAGLLFGDLTDGQDSNITSSFDRRTRSSAGREVGAHMIRLLGASDSDSGPEVVALDHIPSLTPPPRIVSASVSYGALDSNCTGGDSLSVAVDNLLYENGILLFQSAGNLGGSSSDCRVKSPGSAAGVFTVGGWGETAGSCADQGVYADDCEARSQPVHPDSSWGGSKTSYSDGKYRSIIDVLGSYQHRYVPKAGGGYYTGAWCGTSFATPAVAGSAASFYTMFRSEIGAGVDDPGVLFAWMLNMGDRQGGSVHVVEGFGHHYGAGRLMMRSLSDEGMDAPWGYYSGWTCIDDGETYTLSPGTLSGDVDSLEAVIWWYDRRLETGGIDDIDLELFGDGSPLRSSADRYDNKERVFYKDIGGFDVDIKIYGYDVTSDVEGCGANSMKVFFAVLWEDNDRDDQNGPTWNSSTCRGVDRW